MLRERRQIQLAQRNHCRRPHVIVGVIEPSDHAVDVLRERCRLQIAQRIQCNSAHWPIVVLEPREQDIEGHILIGVLIEALTIVIIGVLIEALTIVIIEVLTMVLIEALVVEMTSSHLHAIENFRVHFLSLVSF